MRRLGRVEEFAAAAADFLARDEVAHTVLYGIVEALTARPSLQRRGPYLAVLQRGEQVVGAAALLPPNPLAISPLSEVEALPALVDDLAECGVLPRVTDLPCVVDVAERAAALLAERQGQPWRVRVRERLYRIDAPPPVPAIPGSFRMAGEDDVELLVRWTLDFNQEAWGTQLDAETVRAGTRLRVDGTIGGVGLWEDAQPVSMAAFTARSARCARIAPVYTPLQHRRHGYGGAVTAGVTRHLFESGVDSVVLFTDLANATANHVCTGIGFRPVSDWLHLTCAG